MLFSFRRCVLPGNDQALAGEKKGVRELEDLPRILVISPDNHRPAPGLYSGVLPDGPSPENILGRVRDDQQIAVWAMILAVDVVASMFGVHWNTVYSAVKKAVAYGLEHRELGSILYIGVDEISRKKGHRCLMQVYDLEGKRLLWSGKNRKKETLEEFFDLYGEKLRGSEMGVCCDMWAPYINVITKHLPVPFWSSTGFT